ncbi:hypothetical protein PInf_024564 [Phytophthora infestans]|nr:hypothetical protein PInf_024564 [Phytophthora infestans]
MSDAGATSTTDLCKPDSNLHISRGGVESGHRARLECVEQEVLGHGDRKNGDNAKVHLIHFTLNAASSVNIILFTARTRKSALLIWRTLVWWYAGPVGGSTSGGDLTEHDVREGVGRVERQAISDVVTVDKSVVSNLVSLLETSANAGMLVHVFMLTC